MMILTNLQNDLQLVSEVSRSSEESLPISPSLGKFLQAKLREQCCSSAASNTRSPMISSHNVGGITNSVLPVVDEQEYQVNGERLIEANTNLQDAINLSRRTPLTPASITAGIRTHAHSSCFSFYRFDDALYKRAAGFVPSRESGRDSINKWQLHRKVQISNNKAEATEDQAMDGFIDQLDLDGGNEEARVQNISDYLNVRRTDPLLLYPNLQLEYEPLPCCQIPAVYHTPMTIAGVKHPVMLEKFQF